MEVLGGSEARRDGRSSRCGFGPMLRVACHFRACRQRAHLICSCETNCCDEPVGELRLCRVVDAVGQALSLASPRADECPQRLSVLVARILCTPQA